MKMVRDGGEDVGTPVEEVALVVTDMATVEMNYHAFATRPGRIFIFSGPRVPDGAQPFRECGCNPYLGHVIARSIEDARRLRDALNTLIAYAEARA